MRSLSAIALLAVTAIAQVSHAQTSQWGFGNPSEFTGEGTGSIVGGDGARLTLKSSVQAPAGFGTGSVTMPADTYRGGLVRLRGEIRTRHVVGGGGSLWLRVDGPSGMLVLDNGTDQAIRGDSGWVVQEIKLPVPRGATKLVLGAMLRGTGELDVRGLRLDTVSTADAGEPTGMAKTVIDSAFALVRTHAMWRDTVSWNVVEPNVRDLTRGATVSSDVYPAIRSLLASLGDHHSFFMPPRQTTQFRTGGAENPRAVVKALDGGIGYISVPAYGGVDPQAAKDYARAVHDSLVVVMPRASCGWIVDLRSNGGGNMYPMLNGLKSFLGDSALGAFVGPNGRGTNWFAPSTQPPPQTLASLINAYVAVLTGPRTGSSGEAVTISFKGRARTRSFGSPTAGLSTANATYALPDGSMIVLTTAIEADRTGKTYGQKVDPDEVIAGPNSSAAESDSTAAAAVRWLKQESRCQ
jgi:C-terminal processing protease CtpA/Prc